jgi:hypothetical protein
MMRMVVITTVLLLGVTAVAGASPTGARSSDVSFCAASKNVASYLANVSKELSSRPTPARLKAEFGAIRSAEPSLKSSAPANLKPHVVKVLALADTIAARLAKAKWNLAGLLSSASTLEVQAVEAAPSILALNSYYRTTCKFHV